jgi:adenine-specific DNA methylase
MSHQDSIPRAIEVGFPIVEINRLAVPERNSFKPIYQMHKWFARRASCVFRAILLGSLKPAYRPDGSPVDLMEEFYKDHTDDPDTKGMTILDPFMGGGTTVVEALRLGCHVTGIDLNPVAWFIVKTEVEPVDLQALQKAFDRLAERPVAWNGGKPLRETLLDLYKTEVEPGIEADVIYTFWVKHAVCTAPTCGKEVPLFKDYIIARKTPSIRYNPDVTCPNCKKIFDWEIEVASLIAEPSLMVSAPRGSAGEGRPTQAWSYAPHPGEKIRARVACPHCGVVDQPGRKQRKPAKKRVSLTVLFCPRCEAVWQWRGDLPDGDLTCPACRQSYDPHKGNVPEKGKFLCRCGNKDKIIESIRRLPKDQRLPLRPYALQAYLSPSNGESNDDPQGLMFHGKGWKPNTKNGRGPGPKALLLPRNGKLFKGFSSSDQARLQQAETLWGKHSSILPYPRSEIPVGEKTKSGLLAHHYNYWHEMFFPRQLLALATLLKGIMEEADEKMKEMLLCSFSGALEQNNQLCRYMAERKSAGGQTVQGVFARHDFQPKITITENNVFGIPQIAMGSFESKVSLLKDGISYGEGCWDFDERGPEAKRSKLSVDQMRTRDAVLQCKSSSAVTDTKGILHCITDPPYVGNVNYAELSDFYHVWLRLALKETFPHFSPEYTPKADEIVENRTRGKSRENFYEGLQQAFFRIKEAIHDDGLLVFTFHHTDEEGLVWEGLLRSLCETGFEIVAVYPIHGESESSLHLMDKENVSYDLIHVCKKRRGSPEGRSWAGLRQEVRRRAREELQAIEKGRYGREPLNPSDVRLICIGKCLEVYSRHYGKVLDHEGKGFPLHAALQDIGTIVDQLVTRERPLPVELEDIDPLSYVWFRVLMEKKMEINVNDLNKALRGVQVSADDLKKAGLIIKGRTGRGRFFKVKQPEERLGALKERLEPASSPEKAQFTLFDEMNRPIEHAVDLVDVVHLLIGLAWAGESVVPWLERYAGLRPKLKAALSFVRDHRKDWKDYIDRILNLVEGKPLLRNAGEGSPQSNSE